MLQYGRFYRYTCNIFLINIEESCKHFNIEPIFSQWVINIESIIGLILGLLTHSVIYFHLNCLKFPTILVWKLNRNPILPIKAKYLSEVVEVSIFQDVTFQERSSTRNNRLYNSR